MKKNFTLIALTLISGSVRADFWDNCTAYGGTIITANSYGNDKSGGLCNDPSNPNLTNNCNGKRFCMSGKGMNWWSAFTWCEAIGGKQASFTNMCPGIQINTGQVCANLKKSGIVDFTWTNMGWSRSNNVPYYALNLDTQGNVVDGYSPRNRTSALRALCEP
jgi:hypothetical protein